MNQAPEFNVSLSAAELQVLPELMNIANKAAGLSVAQHALAIAYKANMAIQRANEAAARAAAEPEIEVLPKDAAR